MQDTINVRDTNFDEVFENPSSLGKRDRKRIWKHDWKRFWKRRSREVEALGRGLNRAYTPTLRVVLTSQIGNVLGNIGAQVKRNTESWTTI